VNREYVEKRMAEVLGHGEVAVSPALVDVALALVQEALAEHKCKLPDSIEHALNSGDGVYRP